MFVEVCPYSARSYSSVGHAYHMFAHTRSRRVWFQTITLHVSLGFRRVCYVYHMRVCVSDGCRYVYTASYTSKSSAKSNTRPMTNDNALTYSRVHNSVQHCRATRILTYIVLLHTHTRMHIREMCASKNRTSFLIVITRVVSKITPPITGT